MKRQWGFICLVSILLGGIIIWAIPKKILRNIYLYSKFKIETREREMVLGVFEWNEKNVTLPADSFQYIDIRITGYDDQVSLEKALSDNGRPLFVTVDMWNLTISENPLAAMLKGKYDGKIKEICALFENHKSPVFIRWNPEMEVPSHLYPWQGQSPKLFIEAFTHFSKACRNWLPGARIVWSTAGYPGVLEYFPGDETFDYASVTLQSESERSTKAYPDYESVSEEATKKILRMRFLHRPVFILGDGKLSGVDSVSSGILEAGHYIHKNSETIYQTATIEAFKGNVNVVRDIKFGVYDPNQKLNTLSEISTEHIFPNWKSLGDGSFSKEFNSVMARKHDVIITMEPWKEAEARPDRDILLSIVNGRYDDRIRELFNIISRAKQTVYLRWIHEMEIPVTRYPWQSQPPVDYIRAYRHLASFRKPEHHNIKLVWGPAGDRGLQDWWPGADVVDFISMAIYGLPDKNITDYKKQESFKAIFNRKIYRMRFFNKPVFITEFGISGPEEYQLKWLLAASETINENPRIKGVCYFNMVDTPKAWGDIETPDWSVSRKTYRSFVRNFSKEFPLGRTVTNHAAGDN